MSSYYIDGKNYSTFIHMDHRTNNFVEKIGEIDVVPGTAPTTHPFAVPPPAYFKHKKLGNVNFLEIISYPDTPTNSNGTTNRIEFAGVIQADDVPENDIVKPCILLSNNVPTAGMVMIKNDGGVVFTTLSGTNFTNAAPAGIYPTHISWESHY